MLESISWNQFLSVLALMLGAYYVICGLLLFNREIVSILKQRRSNETSTGTFDDQIESSDYGTLMGKAKSEPISHENTMSTEELSVSRISEPEESINQPGTAGNDLIVGNVADLLEEIKSLASGLEGASREEVSFMFRQLLARHNAAVGTTYRDSVNLVILGELAEKCNLHFETIEIDSWWQTQL